MGLVNNILHVAPSDDMVQLKEHLKDEPMFTEVLDVLLAINNSSSVHDHQHAQHWASQYLIVDSKLWHLKGGTSHQIDIMVEFTLKNVCQTYIPGPYKGDQVSISLILCHHQSDWVLTTSLFWSIALLYLAPVGFPLLFGNMTFQLSSLCSQFPILISNDMKAYHIVHTN